MIHSMSTEDYLTWNIEPWLNFFDCCVYGLYDQSAGGGSQLLQTKMYFVNWNDIIIMVSKAVAY